MTREEVLEIFERHRKEKNAPFNESYFLDFLISNPKKKGAIRNSFSGLRRFYKFWNEVQLSQGICFSINDRDIDYSLNDFVDRVNILKGNPKSSKAALRHQMKSGFEWGSIVFVNVLLVGVISISVHIVPVAAIFLVIGAYANYKLVNYLISEKRYLQELSKKLGLTSI
jgi:hypothetical protein